MPSVCQAFLESRLRRGEVALLVGDVAQPVERRGDILDIAQFLRQRQPFLVERLGRCKIGLAARERAGAIEQLHA